MVADLDFQTGRSLCLGKISVKIGPNALFAYGGINKHLHPKTTRHHPGIALCVTEADKRAAPVEGRNALLNSL